MNFRRVLFATTVLAGLLVEAALLPVKPVAAGSIASAASIPARFLVQLPSTDAHYFATQAADAGKKAGEAPLPDGKGKDLALKYCTTCHAANVWTKLHYTREQWSGVMDNMVSKGLDAPDADIDTITNYLTEHFAPAKTTPQAGAPDGPAAPPPQ